MVVAISVGLLLHLRRAVTPLPTMDCRGQLISNWAWRELAVKSGRMHTCLLFLFSVHLVLWQRAALKHVETVGGSLPLLPW